jgi:hypothetical protein
MNRNLKPLISKRKTQNVALWTRTTRPVIDTDLDTSRVQIFNIYFVIVGSHSSHVPYARDLCEARIYAANTASEEQNKHPSTNNAYVLQYSDTRAR